MSENQQSIIAALWVARAKDGNEDRVRELISRVVTPARNDPGNIDYEVHEEEGSPGTFVVYERWSSKEALDAHTRSAWIPKLIPPLLELIEGNIEDELRFLRPLRPSL